VIDVPDTKYARTADGVYIAYQMVGDGPVDIVWQLDRVGNVDLIWQHPIDGPWLRGLASLGRLILHDRRGTGLSSRNVTPPDLETRVADLRVVLDAVDSTRPVLAGALEGGAPNVLFAASDPDRVSSIIWWAPSARSTRTADYPWGVGPEDVEADERALEAWGTLGYARAFVETEATGGRGISEEHARATAFLSRHTATPDVAQQLGKIWYETDVRAVLPTVQTPTLILVREVTPENVAEARYIASVMPDAELDVLPGPSEESPELLGIALDIVRRFVGVDRPPHELNTILSTVLFTDIVDSTATQARAGDRAWKELALAHHALVRDSLGRWGGRENDTAGDGFYATFDGPARAIRCAQEVVERVRPLGIQIRAGVHTGECEVIDDKCGGLTVSIGARVATKAGASEVLVSQTVKDLVAGSGLAFEDAGDHELKGVPDRWHLYRVAEPGPRGT
jgi:class 3 adenylate cyclase